jgi:hypothetical protein
VHDTPEHNGVAEKLNRTVLERTRALLHASGLPKTLWAEGVHHVIWLKNRSPTRALNGQSPFEAMKGRKPNLDRLEAWDARCWVHEKGNSKLDGRAREGRWLGFDEGSNGHRIYWESKRSASVERSVVFANPPQLEGEPLDVRQGNTHRTTQTEGAPPATLRAETKTPIPNSSRSSTAGFETAQESFEEAPHPSYPVDDANDKKAAPLGEEVRRSSRARTESAYVKRRFMNWPSLCPHCGRCLLMIMRRRKRRVLLLLVRSCR